MLAGQMRTLASMVFQCPNEAIELADGFARIKDNPEAALPFMALGAIPNANNAGLPRGPAADELPLRLPAAVRRAGQGDASSAT